MSIETKKLTLAELKAKAEIVSEKELLDQIKGGTLDDCHDANGNPLPSKTASLS